jgi:hypothetical protein
MMCLILSKSGIYTSRERLPHQDATMLARLLLGERLLIYLSQRFSVEPSLTTANLPVFRVPGWA